MKTIGKGSYPGGPSPAGAGSPNEPPRSTPAGAEEIEARALALGHAERRRRKVRRVVVGFVAVLLLSGGLGFYLGVRSHTTSEELAEEHQEEVEPSSLSRDRERLLNELWKMEDLERAPRMGGTGGMTRR